MGNNYFYHRSEKQFYNGQILYSTASTNSETFWGNEFGKYGITVMESFEKTYNLEKTSSLLPGLLTEMVFEWVRQKEFTYYPSRLACVFAHASLPDVKKWSLIEDPNTLLFTYNVESLKCTKADAGWIKNSITCGGELVANARKYWSNIPFINPLPEVLLGFPVTVIHKVE